MDDYLSELTERHCGQDGQVFDAIWKRKSDRERDESEFRLREPYLTSPDAEVEEQIWLAQQCNAARCQLLDSPWRTAAARRRGCLRRDFCGCGFVTLDGYDKDFQKKITVKRSKERFTRLMKSHGEERRLNASVAFT